MVPCNMALAHLYRVAAINKDAPTILRCVPTNGARDNTGMVVADLIIIDAAAKT